MTLLVKVQMYYSKMKFSKSITIFLLLFISYSPGIPQDNNTVEKFNLSSQSVTLKRGTAFELIVTTPLSTKTNDIGDLFIGRLIKSTYSPQDSSLIFPEGSWITGRIIKIERPSRFSNSGSLDISLDYLISTLGEMSPINAQIAFQSDKITENGTIDPQTSFSQKALSPTKKLLKSKTGRILSSATLGLPVAATIIAGSTSAALKKGEDAGLKAGDRIQVFLTDNNFTFK